MNVIKKNEIVEILSVLFKNSEMIDQDKTPHFDDPTGKSTYTGTYFCLVQVEKHQ